MVPSQVQDHLLERLELAVAALRCRPSAFVDSEALAREAGLEVSELELHVREHFHRTVAELLAEARVEKARQLLLGTARSVADVAEEAGFGSVPILEESLTRRLGLGSRGLRRLPEASSFELALPDPFPLPWLLAYLGRDPGSMVDRVRGTTYEAGVWLAGVPVRLSLTLEPGRARVQLDSNGRLPEQAAAEAHLAVLRRLGLTGDPGALEGRAAQDPAVARLVKARPGLRLPMTFSPYEALLWVIVGQQVTLGFAFTLFRRLVEKAGRPAGDGLWAPPRPEGTAQLTVEELARVQFSQRKAEYAIGLSQRIAVGELDLAGLGQGSFTRAEQTLLAERGLGPWSAGYLAMRALGFADCVPVGDAGLVRALARFFVLPARPDAAETRRLMSPFSPHRSLATFHLWQSLEDAP
ncbi:MAG TPA: helix-turn-helix domain-containing protein [Thermoanaerobaculia bacterium]|nr:helix-turn-helix domain-containing protein [Thermoanaerobaculia bacterium]